MAINNSSFSSQMMVAYFLLLTIVLCNGVGGFSPRKLENVPQNSTLSNGTQTEEKGQSKTGVHGSRAGHDGSATGDNSPTGNVQIPPPTAVTSVNYQPVNSNSSPNNGNQNNDQGESNNGNGNNYYSPGYQSNPNYYYSPPSSDYGNYP